MKYLDPEENDGLRLGVCGILERNIRVFNVEKMYLTFHTTDVLVRKSIIPHQIGYIQYRTPRSVHLLHFPI